MRSSQKEPLLPSTLKTAEDHTLTPRQPQGLKDRHGEVLCNGRRASGAEAALEGAHPPASEPDLVGCSKTMAMWPVALVSTCTRTR